MKTTLTIKDIVAGAMLDRRTAKYLLQREGLVERLRLPKGQQRKHRSFTIDQAIRLALCTQLVMVGVPVAVADKITVWAERRWKALTRLEPEMEHLFDGTVSNPWNILLVRYGQYVQLSRERPNRRNDLEMLDDIDTFYSTSEGKMVHFVEVDRHLPQIQWSLSHLAGSLARKK